jgi:hypothetical protein
MVLRRTESPGPFRLGSLWRQNSVSYETEIRLRDPSAPRNADHNRKSGGCTKLTITRRLVLVGRWLNPGGKSWNGLAGKHR